MDKTLREVGEAGFTRMVEKYARTVHPELTRERAFTKVFTEDSDEGRAIRRAWQISKQGAPLDDDEAAEEAAASRTTRSKNWKSWPPTSAAAIRS